MAGYLVIEYFLPKNPTLPTWPISKYMKYTKQNQHSTIRFVLIIACLFLFINTNAQEIKYDTIFVNTTANITLQFPSSIDSFSTLPLYSGFQLKKANNTISIKFNGGKPTQALLALAEGGREHHFLLLQSNNTSTVKVFYDYSTLDKLKDHLWDLKLLKTGNSLPIVDDNLPKTRNDFKYDSLIAIADKAVNEKRLEEAMGAYSEALNLKPTEYYPNAQLRFIKDEIFYLERQKVQQVAINKDLLEVEFQKIIANADSAVKEKRYEAAMYAYSNALAIHPDNAYALQRLKIATNQLNLKTFGRDSSSYLPPTEELRRILNSKFVSQTEPIPYNEHDLKKKYRKINFNEAPEGQSFNTSSVLSRDHSRIMNELIVAQPKVAFSSTDQNIHLINTDITFYDSLVYLKFILQNDSQNDFLTGPMLLTWNRYDKKSIQLFPIYIYPAQFPIVSPGKQTVIIYVCKPYKNANADHFLFNLTDRLDKIHLQIKIPGSAWNNSDYNQYFIKTEEARRGKM